MTKPPLLSICLPTFNRAELLEVCLASVLPQVAENSSEVECVVSDNASTDATEQVLIRYQHEFNLRVFRNATNIGIIGNITKVAVECACGEFVWLIGDDDVLAAGAVSRLLEMLRAGPEIDLIALNVAFTLSTERPTANQALGGVRAIPEKRLRKSSTSGIFPFEDLLEGPCADFTAMYSLALRRSLWLAEYPTASTAEPFSSVESTYPHAAIIAKRSPGKNAGVIAEPAVVIYELPSEQFSWAKHRALSVLVYCTQLLKMYEAHGVSHAVIAPYYIYQLEHRGSELGDLMFNRKSAGGYQAAFQFAWLLRRYPLLLLRAFLLAFLHPQAPRVIAAPLRTLLRLRRGREQPTI